MGAAEGREDPGVARVLRDLDLCVDAARRLASDPDDLDAWGWLRGDASDGEGYAYDARERGVEILSRSGPPPSYSFGGYAGNDPVALIAEVLDRLWVHPGDVESWASLGGFAGVGSIAAFKRFADRNAP